MLTPAGCHEQVASYGHIMLNGIPIQGLVDTGDSVFCLAYSTWWQHRVMLGALHPYHQVIRGANCKHLPIVRRTWYPRLKWGSTTGRASFVVIMRHGPDDPIACAN